MRNFFRPLSIASFLATSTCLQAEFVGAAGGESTDSDVYAAVTGASESVTTVTGLPDSGEISSVSINSAGTVLIAGYFNDDGDDNGYYAFVSPDGTITSSSSLSLSDGRLLAGAINTSGAALVGGYSEFGTPYAAKIAADGTLTALNLTASNVQSAALNDSGVGLLGGEGIPGEDQFAGIQYAAFVADDGIVTAVSGFPDQEVGAIYSVGLNNSGNGIIGGYYYDGDDGIPYAAKVTTDAKTDITGLPDTGSIRSVAINASNLSLVGGYDNSDDIAYAAFISSGNTLTALSGLPEGGEINSVALNADGMGLIGGDTDNGDLYAAFVETDGTVTAIYDSEITGEINAVAINNAGVGLLGGETDENGGYLALVAPNGALTVLTNTADEIYSVALSDAVASGTSSSSITPQSVSTTTSVIYSQLTGLSALQTRRVQRSQVWGKSTSGLSKTAKITLEERQQEKKPQVQLVSQKSETDTPLTHVARVSPRESTPQLEADKPNAVWFEPFGNYVYQDRQGSIPKFKNTVFGGLVGFDHQEDNYLVGTAIGYAHNSTAFYQDQGHGNIDQGMLSLYGTYYFEHLSIAGALWGGRYYFKNTRKTLAQIHSTGKTHGWIFAPNLELASPWALDDNSLYFIEPFASLSWVANWQGGYTETGRSGLNLVMPHVHNSLLQTEAGLRFYEKITFTSYELRLEEKISYMNLDPLNTGSVNTSFIGSASTFPVAVGNSEVLNLATAQFVATFMPKNPSYPFGGFSGQVSANGAYQSYYASIFCGYQF